MTLLNTLKTAALACSVVLLSACDNPFIALKTTETFTITSDSKMKIETSGEYISRNRLIIENLEPFIKTLPKGSKAYEDLLITEFQRITSKDFDRGEQELIMYYSMIAQIKQLPNKHLFISSSFNEISMLNVLIPVSQDTPNILNLMSTANINAVFNEFKKQVKNEPKDAPEIASGALLQAFALKEYPKVFKNQEHTLIIKADIAVAKHNAQKVTPMANGMTEYR